MIYHIMLQYVEKYDRLMMLLYNIISFFIKNNNKNIYYAEISPKNGTVNLLLYIEKKGMISWITLHIKEMKLMAKKNC